MKFEYKPMSDLENFGVKIYTVLVENFPSTFFVGGTVRDILLKRPVADVDIVTSAKPEVAAEVLKKYFIDFSLGYKNLGVLIAVEGDNSAAIATFRKEIYSGSRYPKIVYVKDPKTDSLRRDFTINSLYLSLKTNTLTDYHKGLADLKMRKIKFIGDPKTKIQEDPLRIVRALRFALLLNFKIEKNSFDVIKNKFDAVKLLTKSKINGELSKLKNLNQKKLLIKTLDDKKNLDKYFKVS